MGPDNIHPQVLREVAEEVAKPLSIVFDKLWQFGGVPSDWKRGNVILIFKNGEKEDVGDQTSQSYLGISQDHEADPPGNYFMAHGK